MTHSQRGFLKFYGSILLIGLIGTILHNVPSSSSQVSGKDQGTVVVLLGFGFAGLVALALGKRRGWRRG